MIINDQIKNLILMALEEDIKSGDITSTSIFKKDDFSYADIISKDKGILCGIDLIKEVYSIIDEKVDCNFLIKDGDHISPGDRVVSIQGPTISILSGERIGLNFMQRMSGIATYSNLFVKLLEGSNIKILDTRKTLPGFRLLDKYSVKTGGGKNHRMGLYDMVMIKDNHIKSAGSIKNAVKLVRENIGTTLKVEVETTNLKEVKEAVESGADIIMLDNMDKAMIKKGVDIINGKTEIEVSGNINEKRVVDLKDTGIDFISIGALTHSVKAFDFSMKFNS